MKITLDILNQKLTKINRWIKAEKIPCDLGDARILLGREERAEIERWHYSVLNTKPAEEQGEPLDPAIREKLFSKEKIDLFGLNIIPVDKDEYFEIVIPAQELEIRSL